MEKLKGNKIKVLGVCFAILAMVPISLMATACGNSERETKETQTSLAIHSPFKTVYYVGEEVDTTGGILDYIVDGKTIPVAVTEEMISAFSSDFAGEKQMVVSYKDDAILVDYQVKDWPQTFVLNQTYRSVTQVENNGEKLYSYIKFEDEKTMYIVVHNKDISAYSNEWKGNSSSARLDLNKQEIKDGKWIYNIEILEGELHYSFTIIVVSSTDLIVKSYLMNSDNRYVESQETYTLLEPVEFKIPE